MTSIQQAVLVSVGTETYQAIRQKFDNRPKIQKIKLNQSWKSFEIAVIDIIELRKPKRPQIQYNLIDFSTIPNSNFVFSVGKLHHQLGPNQPAGVRASTNIDRNYW